MNEHHAAEMYARDRPAYSRLTAAAEHAHAADAPAGALKIVDFLNISRTDLSMWLSQGRG